MSREAKFGVYVILHKQSGRAYVGSSQDIVNRYTWHRHALRNGYHPCGELLTLWQEGEEDDFSFDVLEQVAPCSPADLRVLEETWEKVYAGRLLNERTVRGFHQTDETRQKQRDARYATVERKRA